MSESSPQSFLNLLEKSGLVSGERLNSELETLREKTGSSALELDTLIRHLLDQDLVTQWHLEKLLVGKYKGFFLGKYKLLRLLGTGGMSSVYLAEHRLSAQKRAIKVLPRRRVSDKSYLDRFYQEARAAASLNHPNVVRMYDICHEADTHYMVMEYVQGQDLYDLVKANGPLAFAEAVGYCVQTAEGLSHAHKRDLVHRDIKPANLILTDDGTIKILDLGLALIHQEENESLTLLYNEKVMGTADYLAPEQAVNSHDVDRRADIYSLGCTLYFMLTGHPPFPTGTLAQRIAMHQLQEPADIRQSRADCPAELVAICKQMMMKKAELRYQNCVDLRQELEGWLKTGRQLGIGLLPGSLVSAQSDQAAPRDQGSTATIVIDTSGSSKSGRKGSSKKMANSDQMRAIGSGKQRRKPLSSRKMQTPTFVKQPPPKWSLPVTILIMFVILLVLLYFVSRNMHPTVQSRSAPRTEPVQELVFLPDLWKRFDMGRRGRSTLRFAIGRRVDLRSPGI
jgi:eukaryotic-like serine/threonine-protein kinase